MPVLLLLLLLLHTARAANTTTNSFTYSALGADVSAPRFVESNTTWQFDVSVSAAAGDLVFPLLPVPPAACAGGLVPLCCLYGLADGNRELGAYLHYLGPCEAHAGASSAAVLEDAPRPDALMKGMGQLRSWCPTPLACVFELDDTQFFNVTVAYTDDTRELALAVAFVRSLEGSPLVQLALARHTMRFDVRSNSMQFAFRDACEGMSKAPDALWRAGDACLWFCGPGFLLQPSAPSYFAMPPGAPNTCAAVPRPALLLEFELTVTTGWTPAALQLAAAAATGLLEQDTAYYQLPAGFSAVLFSRDCAANASALLATTTAALAGLAGDELAHLGVDLVDAGVEAGDLLALLGGALTAGGVVQLAAELLDDTGPVLVERDHV